MKLFIDTANVKEIQEIAEMGIICGVTTNPSLIAREGRDFEDVVREIAKLVDGPISGEVISTDKEGMIAEGRHISAIHKNMVVKIPITQEGLKAVKVLSSEGIKTNVTLIFTAGQALLAARAGATFVSPFLGRLDDVASDSLSVVKDISDIFRLHQIGTQIIAASIRNPMQVVSAAKMGSNIATVPYSILMQMFKHPLTDEGIEKFQKDWNAAFTKKEH